MIAGGVRDPGPLLAFPRQLHIRLCQLGLKARAVLFEPLQFRLVRPQRIALRGQRAELLPEFRRLLLGRAELCGRRAQRARPLSQHLALLPFLREVGVRHVQLGLEELLLGLETLHFRLRRAQPRARLFQILSQIRFILFEPPQLRIR